MDSGKTEDDMERAFSLTPMATFTQDGGSSEKKKAPELIHSNKPA